MQKMGGIAAFLQAAVAIAMMVVAFGLIGVSVLTDREKLTELVLQNPTPLMIQDLLKFAAAVLAMILVIALFNILRDGSPKQMRVATAFGCLSILFLLMNASVSLYALSQVSAYAQDTTGAGYEMNAVITLLGWIVIFTNGLWYLLLSRSALRGKQFPKPLNYLGLGIGFISLLPCLGIVVLPLSIVWSVWMGWALWQSPRITAQQTYYENYGSIRND